MSSMATMTARPASTASILQRAVCVMLTVHWLGNHRTVDVEELVEAAGGGQQAGAEGFRPNNDLFGVTKKLVSSAVLGPPMRVIGRAKNYLRRSSIPMHRVFGDRSYLIPLALLEEVDARITEFQAELRQEAARCAASYEAAKEQARSVLGPVFREDDYPPAWKVADAFGIEVSYVSFSTPENIETISSALAQKANRLYEQKLAEAFGEARDTLRGMALQVARDLVNKLSNNRSGKPKGVRGTALDDLTHFLGKYRALNLTGDADLDAVVRDLRAVTSGVTVTDVQEFNDVRDGLLQAASAAVQRLEVLTKARAISLTGDLG